jgi:hypothetical protein
VTGRLPAYYGKLRLRSLLGDAGTNGALVTLAEQIGVDIEPRRS